MKKIVTVLFLSLVIFGLPVFAFAATGTIDSTYKYAWSPNAGWINFAPIGCVGQSCAINVTDGAVTGDAWSDNFGWIYLNGSTWGVSNSTSGCVSGYSCLSGYAWCPNTGWINFSGVLINLSNGQFSGTATGDNIGTINFSYAGVNSPVTTTWRLATPTPSTSTGSGGNSLLLINNSPTPTPIPVPVLVPDKSKIVFTRSLYLGVVGQDVKSLQVFLNSQGFTVSKTGAGSPSNESIYFGKKTYNALIGFQKAHANEIFGLNKNMPGLGIFGPKTTRVANGRAAGN